MRTLRGRLPLALPLPRLRHSAGVSAGLGRGRGRAGTPHQDSSRPGSPEGAPSLAPTGQPEASPPLARAALRCRACSGDTAPAPGEGAPAASPARPAPATPKLTAGAVGPGAQVRGGTLGAGGGGHIARGSPGASFPVSTKPPDGYVCMIFLFNRFLFNLNLPKKETLLGLPWWSSGLAVETKT